LDREAVGAGVTVFRGVAVAGIQDGYGDGGLQVVQSWAIGTAQDDSPNVQVYGSAQTGIALDWGSVKQLLVMA
jgi:hypothetical protein